VRFFAKVKPDRLVAQFLVNEPIDFFTSTIPDSQVKSMLRGLARYGGGRLACRLGGPLDKAPTVASSEKTPTMSDPSVRAIEARPEESKRTPTLRAVALDAGRGSIPHTCSA